MQPKLVIFDLDGLMIDSEAEAYVVWKSTFREYFNYDMPLTEYVSYIGQTGPKIEQLLKQVHPEFDCTEAFERMEDDFHERGISGRVSAKKGLHELFDTLDAQKIARCVASSSPKDYVFGALDGIGFTDRIDFAICGDEISHSKPDPEIFLSCAKRLQLSPESCLVLEDSNAGILCALNAGIPVIAVRDLKEPDEALKKDCFAVVDSLFDVIPLLK